MFWFIQKLNVQIVLWFKKQNGQIIEKIESGKVLVKSLKRENSSLVFSGVARGQYYVHWLLRATLLRSKKMSNDFLIGIIFGAFFILPFDLLWIYSRIEKKFRDMDK